MVQEYSAFIYIFLSLGYLLALFVSIRIVMTAPSYHNAVAWIIALFTAPYLTLILYFFFGQGRFYAYAETLQKAHEEFQRDFEVYLQDSKLYECSLSSTFSSLEKTLKEISFAGFTQSNHLELLLNGDSTYEALLDAIEKAEHYILLQFYIVRNDRIGQLFKKALLRKAKQGVQIYFLYDEWGAHAFFHQHLKALRKAGIRVSSFHDPKADWRNRFRLNFRNHRKVVVVDGKYGFVGGVNIGVEYLRRGKPVGWRDTHLALQGPAVQHLQFAFCEDWYWAQREMLNLNWEAFSHENTDESVMILPTGPEKALQTGVLFMVTLINTAKKRLWMASPYFVPDKTIMNALQLAVLRGVEVKILLPSVADHWLVYACSFSFYEEMIHAGVQLYRYNPGFMHQKVVLVDEALSSIGTMNLDNRSLYINFEMTALVVGKEFNRRVQHSLNQDFEESTQVSLEDYLQSPYWFKLATRLTRLLSPLL